MKNNKGFIEQGIIVIQTLILTGVALAAGSRGTDILWGGGNSTGAGFFTAISVLTSYSQLPHVKRDFREQRALEMEIPDPKSLSDEALLSAIRDDGTKKFYSQRWENSLNIAKPTNGGGLRARILNSQNNE